MNRLGDMRISAIRRRLGPVLALALGLAVAACGWRPLYERPSAAPTSGGVSAELAQVAIDPVVPEAELDPLTGSNTALYESRTAQLLQNHLKSALNPAGRPDNARYHLAISLKQQTRAAISLGNGQSTREELFMLATYALNDPKGQKVLEDRARIVTSYDILREPFADLATRRDAQERAVAEIAQLIQTRLAVFLRK